MGEPKLTSWCTLAIEKIRSGEWENKGMTQSVTVEEYVKWEALRG